MHLNCKTGQRWLRKVRGPSLKQSRFASRGAGILNGLPPTYVDRPDEGANGSTLVIRIIQTVVGQHSDKGWTPYLLGLLDHAMSL